MGENGDLEPILRWVTSTPAAPLAADLVPGATDEQRVHLAAAGGLVAALVPGQQREAWPDALQAWVDAAPTPPGTIGTAFTSALDRDPEVFARLYCELVDGPQRRRLGTFFTPSPVVTFMLDMLPEPNPSATLVDPGAGVGAFALAAAARWPDLRIVAVDVNVVTLGFLGAALHRGNHRNVELVHADYLAWLTEQERRPGERLLLVGNPPYTRHQELSRKAKQTMLDASKNLVTSKLAGLSAYFLATSFASMRPDDELCFVLPSTWTEARYGRELRAWLWSQTDRPVGLHLFPADSEIFPGTQVAAMVVRVGSVGTESADLTRHRAVMDNNAVTASTGQVTPRVGEPPRSLGPVLWLQHDHRTGDRVPLGDIANVRRGVATGCNGFFFLTDTEAGRLPDGATVAALRRLRHVEGDVLNAAEHRRIGKEGKPRWLLMLDDPMVVYTPSVQALLAHGRDTDVPEAYLCAVRETWYQVERIDPPHLLVAIMSKDAFRVVRNVARVVHSNSMYGIYLNKPRLAPALAAWLRSDDGQTAMRNQARHYAEGLRKLEPKDLRRVLVPAEVALDLSQQHRSGQIQQHTSRRKRGR